MALFPSQCSAGLFTTSQPTTANRFANATVTKVVLIHVPSETPDVLVTPCSYPVQVSILVDDMIFNAMPHDEIWLTGTVDRTGLTGLLPRNFVEIIGYVRQVVYHSHSHRQPHARPSQLFARNWFMQEQMLIISCR